MSDDGFFSRWARLKRDAGVPGAVGQEHVQDVPAEMDAATTAPAPAERSLPTLEDVDRLGAESDYSAFVMRGVDKAVRRGAMKKLFSDPHFGLIDGLDVYMADFSKPDPVSAAMLGAMQHAQSFFAQALAVEPKEEAAALPGCASGAAGIEHDGTAADCRLAAGAPPVSVEGRADDTESELA